MTVQLELLNWTPTIRPGDLLAKATSLGTGYVGLRTPHCSESTGDVYSNLDSNEQHDLVIADRTRRNEARHSKTLPQTLLPQVLHFVDELPDHDATVAFSTSALVSNADLIKRSQSITELIVRLSQCSTMAIVHAFRPAVEDAVGSKFVPQLTTPGGGPRFPWLRELIQHRADTVKSEINRSEVRAGLLLVNDFFDESHESSQSIEGLGPHHTGDYWHAILHRREPDYGNSKYWFRHVGRHPIFPDLAKYVTGHLDRATGHVADKLAPWRSRLTSGGNWEPFAFVDLCETAENDSDLRSWCEQVQYEEMMLLLEFTFDEAGR